MSKKQFQRAAVAFAIIVGVVAPLGATTLVRASLNQLTASNGRVVVGEVIDAYSYWNAEGTFILTDVRFQPLEVVKGEVSESEMTIVLMGGTVGDVTTLIVGGAELVPGRAYVLFLNEEDLPGAEQALTVRDHCQGVFDLVVAGRGLRAISQANGHPLIPDALGFFDAPGGLEGFPLDAMVNSIREQIRRQDGAATR